MVVAEVVEVVAVEVAAEMEEVEQMEMEMEMNPCSYSTQPRPSR